MKLYEISTEFEELLYNEELTDEELQEKLQSLNMELEEKVANGIGLIQSLKGTADAMKAEIDRLTRHKKSVENRIAQIKDFYRSALTGMDLKKVSTSRGAMSIAKAGGKKPLVIDDEGKIPIEYFDNVPTLNQERLRENLENDEVIPGAHLEERGTYLRIS